jgi:tetratricopeptide (TPR) repeat protein
MRARWIAFAPAFLLELFAAAQALTQTPVFWTLAGSLALHFAACALFVWACVGRGGSNRTRQILVGTMAFIGFPLFGMLAVAAGAALTTLVWMRRPAFAGWKVADVDEIPPELPAQMDMLPALQVEPLADLLSGDDQDLKRAAADALVSTRSGSAVDQLKNLLRDPDLETRLSASLRLVALEDEISLETQTARAAIEQSPRDPAAWRSLAQVYIDYASSGLSDAATNRQYLSQAIEAYQTALRLNPRQHRLALALGRAYLAAGELATARRLLEYAAESEAEQVEAEILLMELAYRQGDFATLARRAHSTLHAIRPSHPERDLVEWWAAAA